MIPRYSLRFDWYLSNIFPDIKFCLEIVCSESFETIAATAIIMSAKCMCGVIHCQQNERMLDY